ncbi:MAG: restriction endonuclease subunit S, partial [Acetobacter sp.]|nr:restriction endonuclease subunit S [Acetobacter sp.]
MSEFFELVDRLCSEGVEWKLLGDIAEIGTGSSNANEGLEEGLYPFYVRSQKPLRKNEYEFDETAIITAGDGNVGKVFHYVEGKYALHQRAYRIHITLPKVMPKYYFYYMCSAFPSYIEKIMYQSSVASIRRSMLTDFPVPLPPLAVQREVVGILDLFDRLTLELTESLSEELELRKKQYAYYREVLLSFDEKSPSV